MTPDDQTALQLGAFALGLLVANWVLSLGSWDWVKDFDRKVVEACKSAYNTLKGGDDG